MFLKHLDDNIAQTSQQGSGAVDPAAAPGAAVAVARGSDGMDGRFIINDDDPGVVDLEDQAHRLQGVHAITRMASSFLGVGTLIGVVAVIGVGASVLWKGNNKHTAGGRQHMAYHAVGSPNAHDTGARNFIRNVWGAVSNHNRSRSRAASPRVGGAPLVGPAEQVSNSSSAPTWKQWSGSSVPVGSTASHRAAGAHTNGSDWELPGRVGSDASFGSWDDAWEDVEAGGRADALGGGHISSPRDTLAGRRPGGRRPDTAHHASDW
eukprot:gene3702-3964_t